MAELVFLLNESILKTSDTKLKLRSFYTIINS